MVHVDRSDRDHAGVRGGRRIKPAAETGFKNCNFDPVTRESKQCDRRHLLEERGQRLQLAARDQFFGDCLDLACQSRELTLGNRRSSNIYSFRD